MGRDWLFSRLLYIIHMQVQVQAQRGVGRGFLLSMNGYSCWKIALW